MSRSLLNNLIETATAAFNGRTPRSNVRLPNPLRNGIFQGSSSLKVSALWTKDDSRPQWNNLGAIAESIPDEDYIQPWSQVLDDLSIPLGILSLKEGYVCLSRSMSGEVHKEVVDRENLFEKLKRRGESLFSPRALGRLRTGQLSFADLEDTLTRGSFSYQARHCADLSQSLQNAIEDALRIEWERKGLNKIHHQREFDRAGSIYDAVQRVAVAYLAARILEDKGFFGDDQLPTDNPQRLLERTVSSINGFFKKALVEELPQLSDVALQRLALHLGSASIFTLVDHRQVGHLYERAIQVMPPASEEIEFDYLPRALQRYYTPIAIAERMVDLLPLERLRPQDRQVFDPAAGSGSLLLAATRRLAAMSDTPDEKETYLATHVAGNDLDSRADLITRVRYTLARESEGNIFPSPLIFDNKNFETFTSDNLPIRARVIIANPPFEEEGNVQRAARFVKLMTSWLKDGDQFSLILPQSFLRGSTHGIKEARKTLTNRSHIFEVWQLPEGAVGLGAEQPVCVVLGEIGKKRRPTLARAVISRAKKRVVREDGFLGSSWVTQLPDNENDWSAAVAPRIMMSVPTIRVGALFHVFSGVAWDKDAPPVNELPGDVEGRPYWKRDWKGTGRLWADPKNVLEEKRYLIRPKSSIGRPYERRKILVSRVANRDQIDPIGAHLDTSGFWPDSNVFCVCLLESKDRRIDESDLRKTRDDDLLFWLLGILASEMGKELSLQTRESRHWRKVELNAFELPAHVDNRIIAITRALVARDQEGQPIPDPDPWRKELNRLVKTSYGQPDIPHAGETPALESWKKERESPALIVTGQVLDVAYESGKILLALDGIEDSRSEAWVSLPQQMPGWAFDKQVFTAELSEDISTFEQLSERPWALREFKYTPRPYLTIAELKEEFAFSNSE